MNTKHQPATPLPWKNSLNADFDHDVSEIHSGDFLVAHEVIFARDAAYIAHTANAYPRQIIAAQELLAALDKEHGDELGVDTAAAANRLAALLRSLGEDA